MLSETSVSALFIEHQQQPLPEFLEDAATLVEHNPNENLFPGYFRITALVAPTTRSCLGDWKSFTPLNFDNMKRRTFDVAADKLPKAVRCSCLLRSNVCKGSTREHGYQEVGEAHYVVEWKMGSALGME
jgi:hypothetical protein